jgi:hypothetical protein
MGSKTETANDCRIAEHQNRSATLVDGRIEDLAVNFRAFDGLRRLSATECRLVPRTYS